MRWFLVIVFPVFIGCSEDPPLENPGDFKCTKEEMDLVRSYLNDCKGTGYFSSACLTWGMKNYCSKAVSK